MSLSVEGHARFDNEAGGDIVCSAVSALVGFLGIIFSEVLPGRGELGAEDGQFWLKIFPEFQEVSPRMIQKNKTHRGALILPAISLVFL